MNRFFPNISRLVASAITLALLSLSSFAQSAAERKFVEESSGGGMFWIIVIVLLIGGGGVLVWLMKRAGNAAVTGNGEQSSNYYNTNGSYEMDGLDVDKELEWLRKTKKPKPASALAPTSTARTALAGPPPARASVPVDVDIKAFQEKMRKLQYSQLPINSFSTLTPAKLFDPLPVSDDPSLLNAIEQANEEFEDDESIRELAVKILTAFRTRNSVDALSQIAIYDLSANLRSKAVSTLTDFDHPSVFEAILLACADPTREVRATAARGLFRLSFDRADAWKRILATGDKFRMSHAARAAVESGIAIKSLERLVHEDLKVANEAFSLVAFMIGSGETAELFKAIKEHRDERIKFAILHVFKVQKDERVLQELEKLNTRSLSPDVTERVKDTIASFDKVMA